MIGSYRSSSRLQRSCGFVLLVPLFWATITAESLAHGSRTTAEACPDLPAPRLAEIEDPSGFALASFYEMLSLTARGDASTRIVHYGDSHVAADLMTGVLREDLALCFGDAGPGFILPGQTRNRNLAFIAARSKGWEVRGLTVKSSIQHSRLGISGISLNTDQAGEWIRISAACVSFDLYFLERPGGGQVQVALDGLTYTRKLSLESDRTAPAYFFIAAGKGDHHSVEMRSLGSGTVTLLGVIAERDSPGIEYDALGINGARAARPLMWDPKLLQSNLQRRDPDLILVAYGTNEVGDPDLDLVEYGKSFKALLERLRRATPRASLLVLGSPDRAVREGGGWRTIHSLEALVEVQRRVAFAVGAAFYDQFRAMGGEGSISSWAATKPALAQPDRVHLTKEGYRSLAEGLYAELMKGFYESIARQTGEI
jgi:lysophospholipase L1-like esterase